MFTHFIENAHVYMLCSIIAAFIWYILCEIKKMQNIIKTMENQLQRIQSVIGDLAIKINYKNEDKSKSASNEYDGIFEIIETRFSKIETRLFHLSKSKPTNASTSEKKVIMDVVYERNEQIFKRFIEERFVLKDDAILETKNSDIDHVYRMWFGSEIGPTYSSPPTCEFIKYLSRNFEWKKTNNREGYWKGLRLG